MQRAAKSTLKFSCENAHYSCTIRPGYSAVMGLFSKLERKKAEIGKYLIKCFLEHKP